MTNKLIRLAEIIQDGFPENIVEIFHSADKPSLDKRLAMTSRAIACHQARAEKLWHKAGKQRSAEERQVAARAELAAFVFACLTGDAKEYADSAVEAMKTLGRQGELDIVKSLSRR